MRKSNSNRYRFHLLGFSFLPLHGIYQSNAYAQKNIKLAQMLLSLGHEVYVYGAEGSEIPCTQFIQTHTLKDIRESFGDKGNNNDIGYDWKNTHFRHDVLTKKKKVTEKFYAQCIKAIKRIKKDDDFLLCTMGDYHKPIADKVDLFLTCEPGVGYTWSFAKFKAFESAFVQSFTYGSLTPYSYKNGNFYDRVISNYFNPDEFFFSEKKDNYLLYLGRIISRKGIIIAHLVSQATKTKLIIAGQGGVQKGQTLTSTIDKNFAIRGNNFTYVGFADKEKRKKLLAHAKATFVPTIYLESFAGTHIESLLSGTPVITTNFGVFGETVQNGINGYRCNTLSDFIWATKKIHTLKPKVIRTLAERYTMENVKWDFQRWFEDLYQVYESSKNHKKKGWHRINKKIPEWYSHITW